MGGGHLSAIAIAIVVLGAACAEAGSFFTHARALRRSGALDLDGVGGGEELVTSPTRALGRSALRIVRRHPRPAFRTADLDAFRRCVDRIQDQPGGHLALMALLLYVQNVRADPRDPERRLISLVSPTFTSCIATVPGGLEATLSAGFTATYSAHDRAPYLWMPAARRGDLAALEAELRTRLGLPPGRLPDGFVQAQLHTARVADPTALRAVLQSVKGCVNATRAIHAMLGYVRAVKARPHDPRYRVVNIFNRHFLDSVGAVPRGLDAMRALGFNAAYQGQDGSPFLVMPVVEARTLAQAERVLLDELPRAFAYDRVFARAQDLDPEGEKVAPADQGGDVTEANGPLGDDRRATSPGSAPGAAPPGRVARADKARVADGGGPAATSSAAAAVAAARRKGVARPLRRRPTRLRQNARRNPDDAGTTGGVDAGVAGAGGEDAAGSAGWDDEEAEALFDDAEREGGGDDLQGTGPSGLAQGAGGGPPTPGDRQPARAGGLDGDAAGLPGDLPLPAPEVLVRALVAYALESILKLARAHAAVAAAALPRFPGDNGTAAGNFTAHGGAAGGGGPPSLPGLPVPGLPANVRVVFGRPPPGAIPLGSMQLPPIFGLPPGAGGPGGPGAGGNASDAGVGVSSEEPEGELAALEARLSQAPLSPEASEAAARELRRLRRMSPQHSDYSSTFDFLEWVADIPWATQHTPPAVSVRNARAQLDADHCGLAKVKRRIVEYLAVTKLTDEARGTILCLLGPPGVGKTSLGQSVAKALGRKFHRISLGGVHSESEIRGHRRTYVGALPGLVMQAIRKCGTNDPVIMLDEIDKLGTRSLHGDPSSALLEVLDPEQNGAYRDHFLNLPFNLSRVVFLATANEVETIHRPLLDRMEVVELSGYTTDDKVRIAQSHLLPKQRARHGLFAKDLVLSDEALRFVCGGYTREAGLRELERQIAALCRDAAARIAEAQGDEAEGTVDAAGEERATGAQEGADGTAAGRAAAEGERALTGPRPSRAERARSRKGSGAGAGDSGNGRALSRVGGADKAPGTPAARTRGARSRGPPNASANSPEGDGDVAAKEAAAATDADADAGMDTPAPAPRPSLSRDIAEPSLERIREVLGPEKFLNESAERLRTPGVAMGLAYTAVGGDLLFVEALHMAGTGKLVLTGRLGEVMRESAQTALSWIRSHAVDLGLAPRGAPGTVPPDVTNGTDVHLHFPAGAVPKDGPSAGVTILSALVSMLSGRVCRSDTAMTGEITLRGLVLPVGGIKEKVVAAHRAGIRQVILPAKNAKDLPELPERVRADTRFRLVDTVAEVLDIALNRDPDMAGEPGAGDNGLAPPDTPGTSDQSTGDIADLPAPDNPISLPPIAPMG